jgi:hypothetical protein
VHRTARPLIAAAAAAVIAFAAPTAASAARAAGTTVTPGWRVVASYQNSPIVEMASGGPKSTWAVELCGGPCSVDRLVLRHWNGKTWQAVPQPADSAKTGTQPPQLAVPPGSKDVFAFYDEYRNVAHPSVTEWTGASWTARSYFTPNSTNLSFAAASPGNVWAFGIPYPATASPAVHFNGKTWAAAPSPGVNAWYAAATSAADIWALGQQVGNANSWSTARWNGRKWTAVPLPSAPKAAHQVVSDFQGLAVGSKNDVWTTGFAELVTSTFWMLHWNGRKWSALKVPYAIDSMDYLPPSLISADGHGGVWLDATAKNGTEYLFHGTPQGRWQRFTLPTLKGAGPVSLNGLTLLPGTTTVYAYGATKATKIKPAAGLILEYTA